MLWKMTCKDVYCVFFQLWLLTGFTVTSLTNVALSGTASQSSDLDYRFVASNAIDGTETQSDYTGSCIDTGVKQGETWWRLILPATYNITSVAITNRIDEYQSINGADILIGNSPENNGNNNRSCAVIPLIASGSTRIFECGGMIGQFVNLYRKSDKLAFCELEVYGEELAIPSTPPGTPITTGTTEGKPVVMGRSLVVVEKKLSWSDALLYCRDFYWDLLSVRSEEEQREVEEMLRTASFPLTKHVWLGLRRYLMAGTWFWMSGASVDYSYWETKSFWTNTSPCGGVATGGLFHWNDLPCGDHLHFICMTDFHEDDRRVKFFTSTRPTPD